MGKCLRVVVAWRGGGIDGQGGLMVVIGRVQVIPPEDACLMEGALAADPYQ